MSEMLFGGFPDVAAETTSPHDRRQARIEQAIAAGQHPLGLAGNSPQGLQLLAGDGGGHRCGDCGHRYLKRLGGSYPKCDLGPNTGGPATDVLAKWPACTRWEPKP